MSGTINGMLPVIEAAGVATRAEIDIDTLADRIIAEVEESDALLWPPELTGVCGRGCRGRSAITKRTVWSGC
jgi:hypothetical protein